MAGYIEYQDDAGWHRVNIPGGEYPNATASFQQAGAGGGSGSITYRLPSGRFDTVRVQPQGNIKAARVPVAGSRPATSQASTPSMPMPAAPSPPTGGIMNVRLPSGNIMDVPWGYTDEPSPPRTQEIINEAIRRAGGTPRPSMPMPSMPSPSSTPREYISRDISSMPVIYPTPERPTPATPRPAPAVAPTPAPWAQELLSVDPATVPGLTPENPWIPASVSPLTSRSWAIPTPSAPPAPQSPYREVPGQSQPVFSSPIGDVTRSGSAVPTAGTLASAPGSPYRPGDVGQIVNQGNSILQGLVNSFTSGANNIVSSLAGIAGGTGIPTVAPPNVNIPSVPPTNLTGISSLSSSVGGLWSSIVNGLGSLVGAVTSIPSQIFPALSGLGGTMSSITGPAAKTETTPYGTQWNIPPTSNELSASFTALWSYPYIVRRYGGHGYQYLTDTWLSRLAPPEAEILTP